MPHDSLKDPHPTVTAAS